MSPTRMTSSSGKSCQRLGFSKVAEGGQGPLNAPAASPRPLAPALFGPFAEPPRPPELPPELVAPALPPEIAPPLAGLLPLEPALPPGPAWLPAALPAPPLAPSPPALVRPPPLLVRPPPVPPVELPLLQAPLTASAETRVRTVTKLKDCTWSNSLRVTNPSIKRPQSFESRSGAPSSSSLPISDRPTTHLNATLGAASFVFKWAAGTQGLVEGDR